MAKAKPTLLSRFQGSLMGVRLGDAMGMPWETMSRKKILGITNGAGVTGFVDAQQQSSSDTFHLKAGDTTDDWQLTETVAESLIHNRGFDFQDMARGHVEAFRFSLTGWGTTTKLAMREFEQWFMTSGKEGRAPNAPSKILSRGNGVAMKVAPLALFHQHERERYLEEDVRKLGCMTHADPFAWITAFALARIIQDMALHGDCNIAGLVSQIRHAEKRNAGARLVKDAFSCRLNDMTSPYLNSASIDDVLLITGSGFDAVESVSVAIACALRHLDDPRAGLLEAVNCGGDTDTNAAMTGAILGARNGIEGWPTEWCNFRSEYAKTLDLGARLLKVVQKEDKKLSHLRKTR